MARRIVIVTKRTVHVWHLIRFSLISTCCVLQRKYPKRCGEVANFFGPDPSGREDPLTTALEQARNASTRHARSTHTSKPSYGPALSSVPRAAPELSQERRVRSSHPAAKSASLSLRA